MIDDVELMPSMLAGAIAGTDTPVAPYTFSPTIDAWHGFDNAPSIDQTQNISDTVQQDFGPLVHQAPAREDTALLARQARRWALGGLQADRTARDKGVNPWNPQGSGSRVIQLARTQIGVPYVWANIDPAGGGSSGFDCSGFTKWVFSRLGVDLPHLSSEQQSMFPSVSRDQLQPGDLVFFHYSDRNGGGNTADHVAIYIGNGKQIGAQGDHVQVEAMDWSHFVGGGRVIDARPGSAAASAVARVRNGTGRGNVTLRSSLNDISTAPAELLGQVAQTVQDTVGPIRDATTRGMPDVSAAAYTPSNFATAFLKSIGAPVTKNNLAAMQGWINGEGTDAKFNPLATTHGMPGSSDFNSIGVQNFTNFQQGLRATVATIKNGAQGYDRILALLKRGNADPLVIAQAIADSAWGTHDAVAATQAVLNGG